MYHSIAIITKLLCEPHCLLYPTRLSVYSLNCTHNTLRALYDSQNQQRLLTFAVFTVYPDGSTLYCLQTTKLIFVKT
jgi:hypothetical protein